MPSKFVVDGDVSKGKAALDTMAGSVKNVGDQADVAGQKLENAADVDAEFAGLRKQIDEARESLERLDDQAEQTNVEIGNPGSGKSGSGGKAKWTELAAAAGGVVATVKGLLEASRAAREGIKSLADSGSKSFGELDDALSRFDESWSDLMLNLADSSQGSMFTGFLTEVTNTAADAAENFDLLDESASKVAAGWAEWAADMAGWEQAANLARETQALLNEEIERAAEAQFKEKAARQSAQVDELRAKVEAQRAAQQEQDALKLLKTEEEINAKIEEQFNALQALAKNTQLTSKDRQEAEKKIADLEKRRLEVLREIEEEQRKTAEAAIKAAEDEVRAREELYEETLEAQREMAEDAIRIEEEKQKELARVEEQAARERQARIEALSKSKEVQGVAGQIQQAANDPQALIKRLASNAGAEGTDEYRKAYRQATMQARGGAQVFSQEEIAKAAAQNAEAMTSSLQANGQLSSEVVAGLSQAVQVAQQNEQEVSQLSQAVRAMNQQLAALSNNGRRRAQTRGNSL